MPSFVYSPKCHNGIFTAGCKLGAALAILWLASLVPQTVEAKEAPKSPLAGRGLDSRVRLTAEEIKELNQLSETVLRFEEQASEYRQAAKQLIETKYKQKRDHLAGSYEKLIVELEHGQRAQRDLAINKFEEFLRRYPKDARYTPDAMFRLSELYFERSFDQYFLARAEYENQLLHSATDNKKPQRDEPKLAYAQSIALMQRLISEFPDYRLKDGVFYLLGYCLGEQGEEDRAIAVFTELVTNNPESRFSAEVWTRIGEYYFAANELQLALDAYTKVLGHKESPFYDKAMYKLAWTHFRLADPASAPEEFQKAVDTFVELLDYGEKEKGRGGELRPESIQYIAISYADEEWGGLEKLIAYIQLKGPRAYWRDIIVALGDVCMDQTRFTEAIAAYELAQERYPADKGAPEVQEKIVVAHERNRNFLAAAAARSKLSSLYSAGSVWSEKYKHDAVAIKTATELTRRSLYSAALFHHRQAQLHKEAGKLDLATATYAEAAKAYGDYLQRFPHDRQLYELTFYHAEALYYSLQFDEAVKQYAKVRDSNTDNKFQETAAFSVILSLESAIKLAEAKGQLAATTVLKSSERPKDVVIKPQQLPALKLNLIAASDKYAAVAPNSDKVPKILYKTAEILYSYDHFSEARSRFEVILGAYPQDPLAEFCSNLIIESHLAEKNYAAVENFTRGLLERPAAPGRREFKAELVKFKTGAMFKLAEEFDAKGELEKAAETYLKLVTENPDTQFADSALNNAAVNFERVKRYDSAAKLYARLVKEHPKSPLADNALFRVGINAERFFDFDKAIQAYLRLVDFYPKSESRPDALYNAALSLENIQDYEKAATNYERYCRLFDDREDAADVCFKIGSVYEKLGDWDKAANTYQVFVKKYQTNDKHTDKVVSAYLKIAEAMVKLGKIREANNFYDLTIRFFARATEKTKLAQYAAQAQFALVEGDFAAFEKLKIEGSGKEQQKILKKKAESLKRIESAYQSVLNYKQIEWTMAALYRIGELYKKFADSILEAPCPADVKREARRGDWSVDEVCEQYKVALEDRANTVEDKAVVAFETAIKKARDLQVINNWTQKTLVALNNLRPREWPLHKELKSFIEQVIKEDSGAAQLEKQAQNESTEPKLVIDEAKRAIVLARNGKLDDARLAAIAGLKADEKNPWAFLALGMVFRRQNKHELSLLALNQAIDIKDNFGEALFELGMVFLAQGDKPKAIAALEKAYAASPNVNAIGNNLGVLRTEVGAYDLAIASLNQAVLNSGGRGEYLLNLGNALRNQQHYAEAEIAYRRALDAGVADALYNLGVLYLDNEIPNKDETARFTGAIKNFKAYRAKVKLSAADGQKLDELAMLAEKLLLEAQKRQERDKRRHELKLAPGEAGAEKNVPVAVESDSAKKTLVLPKTETAPVTSAKSLKEQAPAGN